MLLGALVLLRKSLRDLDRIVPALRDMGARHVRYGARPEHYPVVGEVLIASMAEVAGDDWRDEYAAAWAAAYGIVAGHDDRGRRAARSASPPDRRALNSRTSPVRLASSPMADVTPLRTVEDRLRGARRSGFVGREAELELFRGAIDAPEPPFSVLWIHGPGGVGKTTLLSAFAEAADERGTARRSGSIFARSSHRRRRSSAELERAAGGALAAGSGP